MQFGIARIVAFAMVIGLLAGFANHIVTRPAAQTGAVHTPTVSSAEWGNLWQTAMASKVRLESAQSAVGEGYVLLALEMQLDEGWKTYWRYPGDSGFAPRFDWSGSTNLKSIDLSWPAPLAFDELGERYYGYKGRVVWPLRVTVQDASEPLALSLTLDYGVCADVCIPVSITTSLVVPSGASNPTSAAQEIEAATHLVPQTIQSANLGATIRLRDVQGHRAQLIIEMDDTGPAPEFIILTGLPGVYLGASHPIDEKGFWVPLEADAPETLRGQQVDVTFIGHEGPDENGYWAAAGLFYIQ